MLILWRTKAFLFKTDLGIHPATFLCLKMQELELVKFSYSGKLFYQPSAPSHTSATSLIQI